MEVLEAAGGNWQRELEAADEESDSKEGADAGGSWRMLLGFILGQLEMLAACISGASRLMRWRQLGGRHSRRGGREGAEEAQQISSGGGS